MTGAEIKLPARFCEAIAERDRVIQFELSVATFVENSFYTLPKCPTYEPIIQYQV